MWGITEGQERFLLITFVIGLASIAVGIIAGAVVVARAAWALLDLLGLTH